MNTPDRDQLIKTYIGRILARQSQKKETLQSSELREIAKEVGLSEQEIAAVEQEAKDHFERGQGFVRYKRWDDAINELKEALSLSPVSLEVTHALALAYQSRYQSTQNKADKEDARRLAKQALELNPRHEPSFALLNALDQKAEQKPLNPILSAMILGAVVFPLIGGAGYLYNLVSRTSSKPEAPKPSKLIDLPPISVPKIDVPSIDPLSPTKQSEPDNELPVEFIAGEKGEGLVFHNRGSILNNYPDSSFLNVVGDFENTSKKEYEKLKLKVELIDASDAVVEVEVVDVIADYQAPLRPGDTKGFYTIKKTSPTIKKLKISVQTTESQPAPSKYGESRDVAPEWAFTKPEHLNLFVGERSAKFSQYGSSAYHEALFEFQNRGEGAIKELKIQLSYFDKDGKLLSTDESFVIAPSEPSILPGQTRPHKTIESVSAKFHHYTMSIIEAR